MRLLFFVTLLAAIPALATPEKEILKIFSDRLEKLSNPESFSEFLKDNKNLFPEPSQTPSMVVVKEELPIDGDTYTIAIGYRQVLIKGSQSILNDIWSSPEDYQKYYHLDGSSKVDGTFTKDHFKARIFKKVPAIEDQDYTLDYKITNSKNFTFVRATLDHDTKNFALRDNLKTAQKTPEGVVVREISYLYPLRWWVRAMGPTARATMKTELNKVSIMEQCLVETTKNFPPSDEIVQSCAKKAN